MKTKIPSLILSTLLALSSCGEGGENGTTPPLPPAPIESINQSWTTAEYTIKTPIEKGAIVLTVPKNIEGNSRLMIPVGVAAQHNPTITIVFGAEASFTGTLSIINADYTGKVILKQHAVDKIAVGTARVSSAQILTVNLLKGSFEFACGLINGFASIATRPETFTLGAVVDGDIIIEKGSVKIINSGQVINLTINDNEPLIIEGKVLGVITIAAGANTPITIGPGAWVGGINATQSTITIQPSSSSTTTIGNIWGKDVSVGAGAITGDIYISSGGTISVDPNSTVNGSIDASEASSANIEGIVTGVIKSPRASSSGEIDDWIDNDSSESNNSK